MLKSRNRVVNTEIGRLYNNGALATIITGDQTLDVSYLDSQGNYGYPDFPPERDIGSPFIRWGQYINFGRSTSVNIWRGGPLKQSYSGSFRVPISGIAGSESAFSGTSWGATAYKRMKPTKPLFDLGTSLGELKDLPRQILGLKGLYNMTRKSAKHGDLRLRDLGSFHLAAQFGWLALLRDTINYVETQRKMAERLRWLLKHNGKPVRRGVLLADTISNLTVSQGAGYGALSPVLDTSFYLRQPTYLLKTWTSQKVWAAARFRYWLPSGPRNKEWTRSMMRRLQGGYPSPHMVYNLIPWSWLVDYFTNVGDLIENLDIGVADRLAADYFYLMGQTETVREQSAVGYFVSPTGQAVNASATSRATRFRKTRLHGDPFGFGTNPNDLSLMQLSILGALGISRL